jgi:hypothetical protein
LFLELNQFEVPSFLEKCMLITGSTLFFKKGEGMRMSVVIHACMPTLGRLRQED